MSRRRGVKGLSHPLDPFDPSAQRAGLELVGNTRMRRPDLVIVSGLVTASRLPDIHGWSSSIPTLVLDPTLLEGVKRFSTVFPQIPSQLVIISPHQGFSKLYRLSGIPLRQVHWARWSLSRHQFKPTVLQGPLAVPDDPAVDPQLLQALDEAGVAYQAVSLAEASRSALSGFRGLALPWRHTRSTAPSPWWCALAEACGRPMVGTHTWVTQGMDGISGITLVQPGDLSGWVAAAGSLPSEIPSISVSLEEVARRLLRGHLPSAHPR